MDKLFNQFVDAAGIKRKPDFEHHRTLYEMQGKDFTEEQLANSAVYAGFVDGIQHRPNRHRGPVGTAEMKKVKPESGIDALITSEISIRKDLKDPPEYLKERGVDEGVLQGALRTTQKNGYDAGYRVATGK